MFLNQLQLEKYYEYLKSRKLCGLSIRNGMFLENKGAGIEGKGIGIGPSGISIGIVSMGIVRKGIVRKDAINIRVDIVDDLE